MANLIAHFLNVGHGDCTILKHPSGHISVIDTSNGEEIDSAVVESKLASDTTKRIQYAVAKAFGSSTRAALNKAGITFDLTNPVEFIKARYPDESIFRYIQTHPELDHMRGLDALENSFIICNFWDTANHRSFTPRASDEPDWEAYQRLRASDRNKNFVRGDRKLYFAQDQAGGPGDGIEILSPSNAMVTVYDDDGDEGDWNNMSYVLKVTHGGTSIVLGGDAGKIAWGNILEYRKSMLPCLILKASHHGRLSGYHEEALNAMSPLIAVLSIADECEHEAREEYERHCKYVLSTYDRGTITIEIDDAGKIVKVAFEHSVIS